MICNCRNKQQRSLMTYLYGKTTVKGCSYCDTLRSRVFLSLTPVCRIYFFPIHGKFFTFIIRLCTNVTCICATQGLPQYPNSDSLQELTTFSYYDCHYYHTCMSNEATGSPQLLFSPFCSFLQLLF